MLVQIFWIICEQTAVDLMIPWILCVLHLTQEFQSSWVAPATVSDLKQQLARTKVGVAVLCVTWQCFSQPCPSGATRTDADTAGEVSDSQQSTVDWEECSGQETSKIVKCWEHHKTWTVHQSNVRLYIILLNTIVKYWGNIMENLMCFQGIMVQWLTSHEENFLVLLSKLSFIVCMLRVVAISLSRHFRSCDSCPDVIWWTDRSKDIWYFNLSW